MSTSRAPKWAIVIPLLAAVVSWGLFLAARYSDLVIEASQPAFYDYDRAEVFRPSIWLLFAASAVLGISALVAQRKAIAARAQLGAHHDLARASHRFTNLAVIVALALATVLAITGFFEGFIDRSSQNSEPLVRIANVYAPIVLYTALVVTLLLAAFVFRKNPVPGDADAADDEAGVLASVDAQPVDARPGDARPVDAQLGDARPVDARPMDRRALGLAYAAPIILTAFALILGLIVYDVTGTAPQVWVWVIIQALIGAGIVTGTVLARRARGAHATAAAAGSPKPPSAVSGARVLNFVLSIVFGVVVIIMSLSYGASAINRLSIAPYLWVEVYPGEMKPNGEMISSDALTVTVNGFSLDRGASVSAVLEPGGEEVLTGTADREGVFYDQDIISTPLEPGDYTVTASALAGDGTTIEVSIEFTIAESGNFQMGSETPTFGGDAPRLVPPTADWVLNDFVPALLLLLLACAGIYLTLVARNTDRAAVRTTAVRAGPGALPG
jgi:hypothetical protein